MHKPLQMEIPRGVGPRANAATRCRDDPSGRVGGTPGRQPAAIVRLITRAYELREPLEEVPQGVTSLPQAAIGETMTYRAAHGASPASVRTLFDVLNNADTVKIAFLAAMIAAASTAARRAGAFSRWLATGGIAFAPLLALNGLAFPLNSSALYASLELTLLGLLTWVVASTVTIARHSRRDGVGAAVATA